MDRQTTHVTGKEIADLLVSKYPNTPIVGSTIPPVVLCNKEATQGFDTKPSPEPHPIDWGYFNQFIGMQGLSSMCTA